jgi:hypothetical protein
MNRENKQPDIHNDVHDGQGEDFEWHVIAFVTSESDIQIPASGDGLARKNIDENLIQELEYQQDGGDVK